MPPASRKAALRRHAMIRRIIVAVIPPVDELDLVGPLQVFNSVNRLAGRTIYSIEVVTNAERLVMEGEGGVRLCPPALEGRAVRLRLLVCGMGSRLARDATLWAWLKKSRSSRGGSASASARFSSEAGLLNGRRATAHWSSAAE